jgi:hypothetical protein
VHVLGVVWLMVEAERIVLVVVGGTLVHAAYQGHDKLATNQFAMLIAQLHLQ